MLDALSDRLQGTFQRLGNKGRIGETELDEALREVRIALLEADVNFKVVRDLVARVRERSLGQEVLKSITPAQQIIGIVNDELVETLGKENAPLLRPEAGPLKIMVVGTKGGGKTTLAGRLALKFKNEGMKPLLISTDFERVAASEQLQVLARSIGVDCYVEEQEAPAGQVAKRGLKHAEKIGANAIDEVDPTELLIVVDAMTGQEAVTLAKELHEVLEGTGIVVTKVDSDTRGGAVLSVREVTGLPVKFITTGERLEALEEFHPDRFASRVLGMGDVVSLVEKARKAVGERDMKEVARRMQKGQFDLEDFLTQMQQMKQMGPLSGILDMLPGAGALKGQLGNADLSEAYFKQSEAIIQSMTPGERRKPETINGSRRKRIARGSGTTPADVNRLLNQFKDARKLMQAMTSGKRSGGLMKMLGM